MYKLKAIWTLITRKGFILATYKSSCKGNFFFENIDTNTALSLISHLGRLVEAARDLDAQEKAVAATNEIISKKNA
jgi:hypothetical protein